MKAIEKQTNIAVSTNPKIIQNNIGALVAIFYFIRFGVIW